jgi:hypothetical protein
MGSAPERALQGKMIISGNPLTSSKLPSLVRSTEGRASQARCNRLDDVGRKSDIEFYADLTV